MEPGSAYLAASAAGALNTANALRPVRRGALSVSSFFPGWLTSELPLVALGLQALGTAAFAATGGLKGWRGKAGMALTAASWAGLVYLEQVGRRSDEVLEAALVEAFGADDRDRVAESMAPHLDAPIEHRDVVAPRRWKHPDLRMVENLTYGEFGFRNQLDVYHRQDMPQQVPVLLNVHGGAWIIGAKDQQGIPLLAHLAKRGWVCVSTNYRLSPRSKWPDHIVDVKRAIAWVKENIAEYGGDPNFIVITGGSAGGHLSSLAALTPNQAQFQPGFEDADTRVQACVPFYGVYDFLNREQVSRADMQQFLERMVFGGKLEADRDRWTQASSMTHVHAGAPPFFVVHGANDSLSPVGQARLFVRLLREASEQPVAYAELPLTQHAFETFSSSRTHRTVRAVERFAGVVYGDHLRAAAAEAPAVVAAGS